MIDKLNNIIMNYNIHDNKSMYVSLNDFYNIIADSYGTRQQSEEKR